MRNPAPRRWEAVYHERTSEWLWQAAVELFRTAGHDIPMGGKQLTRHET
jgi:hypothetical protein